MSIASVGVQAIRDIAILTKSSQSDMFALDIQLSQKRQD